MPNAFSNQIRDPIQIQMMSLCVLFWFEWLFTRSPKLLWMICPNDMKIAIPIGSKWWVCVFWFEWFFTRSILIGIWLNQWFLSWLICFSYWFSTIFLTLYILISISILIWFWEIFLLIIFRFSYNRILSRKIIHLYR